MNVLIIEDEEPASSRLEKLLKEINPSVIITDVIVSVKSAIQWFKKHDAPHLVMMDIQLSDGMSFDIFKEVEINCPIIFITAFDQYAIQAFKVNSIDYLLKPVKKEELAAAIEKYKKQSSTNNSVDYSNLIEMIKQKSDNFQKRIIIRYRDQIKTIEIDDIAYFYVENKITYISTKSNIQYQVDHNLDEIEEFTDPKFFFRINRQFIVNINAIEKMVAYSKSRVKLTLTPHTPHETIVSNERSAPFKIWLLGKN
ncbi:MAG: LytTR family DNA-binding domain-containing protein [Bacteroidia bacterium]